MTLDAFDFRPPSEAGKNAPVDQGGISREIQAQHSDNQTRGGSNRTIAQGPDQHNLQIDFSAPIYPDHYGSMRTPAPSSNQAEGKGAVPGGAEAAGAQAKGIDTGGSESAASAQAGEGAAHAKRNFSEVYSHLKPGQHYIGVPEDHGDHKNESAYAHSLKTFKEKGHGTGVGMEFFRQSQKAELDDYARMVRAAAKGDHQYDDKISEARKKLVNDLSNQFDVEGDDDKRTKAHADAESIMKTVDAAARNGLKIIPLEPDVPGLMHDGAGFNDMREKLRQIGGSDQETQALKDYMGQDPGKREAAAKFLKEQLGGSTPEGQKSAQDFLNNLDVLRNSNPPIDMDKFNQAIDYQHQHPEAGKNWETNPNDPSPFTDVIQDFRNRTWAHALESQGPGSKIAVLGGNNHFPSDKKSGVAEILERDQPGSTVIVPYVKHTNNQGS